MQIQSTVSRKIGKKEYKKYWVVIPPKVMKELGWKKGDKVDPLVINKKLLIDLK